jgi:hypothetical protein
MSEFLLIFFIVGVLIGTGVYIGWMLWGDR